MEDLDFITPGDFNDNEVNYSFQLNFMAKFCLAYWNLNITFLVEEGDRTNS